MPVRPVSQRRATPEFRFPSCAYSPAQVQGSAISVAALGTQKPREKSDLGMSSGMGGACSLQSNDRQDQGDNHLQAHPSSGVLHGNSSPQSFPSKRHSIEREMPDKTISDLYPVEDNYVTESDGTRSPKSLAELATDSLCRALPNLQGDIPSAGIPIDVIDDVVRSLIQHSVINANILSKLKDVEIGVLSLAGCRGVNDSWLEQLGGLPSNVSLENVSNMDLEGPCAPPVAESASLDSFASASTSPDGETVEQGHGLYGDSFEAASMQWEYEDSARTLFGAPSTALSRITILDLSGSRRVTDRGLLQLTGLVNVEDARLDDCHSITGKGLIALSNCHSLESLSLKHCRRLKDEGIMNVSHLLELRKLNLLGCRCITDQSLISMGDLVNLEEIDLQMCDLITEVGLERLSGLVKLRHLNLGWCRQVSDTALDLLSSQPGRSQYLEFLGLGRCPITNEGIQFLSRLHAAVELDLNGCDNLNGGNLGRVLTTLPALSALNISYCRGILRSGWQGCIDGVKRLDLRYSAVTDSHMAKLTRLPVLEELILDSCQVGDRTIDHLVGNEVVPSLTLLDLSDTNVSDLGMAQLGKMKTLKSLSLLYCNITGNGVRHIMGLRNLEYLNMDKREVSDDGLRQVRQLTKLKHLDIFSGRITDLGCGYIAKLPNLESLELCGGYIADTGCALLATLENLKHLNLSQNERITNRGAAALAALYQLRTLNLSHTRVNSSALRFFSGMVRLESLTLYGCHGVDNAYHFEKLQDQLPRLSCIRLDNTGEEDGTMEMVELDDDMDSQTPASVNGSDEEFFSDEES